jgi:hypothetical protein
MVKERWYILKAWLTVQSFCRRGSKNNNIQITSKQNTKNTKSYLPALAISGKAGGFF